MKKLFLFVLIIVLLSGCARPAALDEGYDPAQLETAAKAVVTLAGERDFAGICALLRADLTEQIDAAALKAGWEPMLEQAGDFVEIARVRLSGTPEPDPANGERYAVAVVTSRHAHGQLTYTLSFDHELLLVGLYLK